MEEDQRQEEEKAPKRKRDEGEVKKGKTQRIRSEGNVGNRVEKRSLEDAKETKTHQEEKRLRGAEESNRESEEDKQMESIERDLNISSVRTAKERRAQKAKRNQKQNLKVVGEVNIGKLLKMTSKLPDPKKFHEIEDDVRQVSNKIAWDDLTGMTLDAGKVVEARAKEVQYVRNKNV